MSETAPARDRAVGLILVLGVIAMLGVRLHVLDDDFPNPDIAGLVYSAELILEGGRPYVDTVEIKPPAAFLMAAGAIALLGRTLEALQLVHALWLGFGGLGVWWAARALHDRDDDPRLGPRCAAVATAVYLVSAAMFTYNYTSWMTPASALAVGLTAQGLRRDSAARLLGAGALAMVAFLTIQRAVFLGLVLLGLWAWARRRALPGARPRALVLGVLGGALALAPFLLWYADALGLLMHTVVPVEVGLDYTAPTRDSAPAAVAAALLQLVTVYWFPVALVVLAGVAAASEPERDLGIWVPGTIWLAAAVFGAGLGGMRYYLHYLVQYAPALGLLAGHPALVRAAGRAVGGDATRRAKLVLAAALLLCAGQLLEIGLGRGHRYEAMARRLTGGMTAAQAAGAHIIERTTAEDTVLAWGWTAWPVYYWSQHRSPCRIYKAVGSVTTFTSNTALDSGGDFHFRDGPLAREMIESFDRAPPAYFVYSPSNVQAFGATVDPLQEFTALRTRLERDYVPEAKYGDLVLLRRRPATGHQP